MDIIKKLDVKIGSSLHATTDCSNNKVTRKGFIEIFLKVKRTEACTIFKEHTKTRSRNFMKWFI